MPLFKCDVGWLCRTSFYIEADSKEDAEAIAERSDRPERYETDDICVMESKEVSGEESAQRDIIRESPQEKAARIG